MFYYENIRLSLLYTYKIAVIFLDLFKHGK